MTRHRIILLAGIVLLSAGLPRVSNAGDRIPIGDAGKSPASAPATASAVKPSDLKVLQKLHDGNQTEAQMGRLAADKGISKAVKAFGRRLVADHTLADRRIEGFLKTRGLDLTALGTTTSADAPHDVTAEQTGTEFDRTFAAQMVADHRKAIALVTQAADTTTDQQLKALYKELLPTLETHLKTAQDLAEGRGRV